MAESDAGAAGMAEQLRRLFPDGKWSEFPYRGKKPRIAIDLEVAGPLFDLIPQWNGDWRDFIQYLRRSGCSSAELPTVSIKELSNVAAEQAQQNRERRQSLGFSPTGAAGTSVSSFVTLTAVDTRGTSNAEDDAVERLAERIVNEEKSLSGVDELLQALLEKGAIGGTLCDSDELAEAALGAAGRGSIRTILARTSALELTTSQGHRSGGQGLTAFGEKVIRRVFGLRAMRPAARLA
jgi:hypothetical protein